MKKEDVIEEISEAVSKIRSYGSEIDNYKIKEIKDETYDKFNKVLTKLASLPKDLDDNSLDDVLSLIHEKSKELTLQTITKINDFKGNTEVKDVVEMLQNKIDNTVSEINVNELINKTSQKAKELFNSSDDNFSKKADEQIKKWLSL